MEFTDKEKNILKIMIDLSYSLLDMINALELKGEGDYVDRDDLYHLAEKLGIDV